MMVSTAQKVLPDDLIYHITWSSSTYGLCPDEDQEKDSKRPLSQSYSSTFWVIHLDLLLRVRRQD